MTARSKSRQISGALAAASLSGAVLAAVPVTAHAEPPPGGRITFSTTVSCTQSREPVVHWTIHNPNPVAATLGQVESWPSAIEEYSERVPAYGSVTGIQRPGKYALYAGIALHATFDDLTLTKTFQWVQVRSCW